MTQEADFLDIGRFSEGGPRRPSRLQRQRPPGLDSLERNPGRVPLKPLRENNQRRSGGGILNFFKSSKRKTTETLPSVLEREPSHDGQGQNHAPKRANTFSAMPSPRLTHKDSRKSVRSRPSDSEKPVLRTSTTWDPPPLFQAYPQSIKHGRLQASNLSADHILLLNHRRMSLEQGDIIAMEAQAAAYEPKGKNGKHRRSVSGSISRAEWTEKIYVLVTSGYLLQYASDGHHDRLPEKILQLNKDSVAFASDAIPGKHWVLQISRTAEDDGALDLRHSRSLLSRFGFHSQEAKRTCKSFLLIMNSPEELDSWLATVRREIESLGSGKYFHAEATMSGSHHTLEHRTSRTLLIKRDTLLSSNPVHSQVNNSLPTRLSFYSQDDHDSYRQEPAIGGSDSLAGEIVCDQQSTTSDDATHDLREGRRQSVLSRSSGLTVSRSSVYISEPSTPPAIAIDLSTMPAVKISEIAGGNCHETYDQHPVIMSTSERRKSAVAPNSDLSGLNCVAPSTSPVTPNFSMPSFSKRFSAAVTSASPQPPQRSHAFSSHPFIVSQNPLIESQAPGIKQQTSIDQVPTHSRGFPATPTQGSRLLRSLPASSASAVPSVFPKRLSSLEYASGKFPAPSPPPNAALPRLPKEVSKSASALRRPVSMQLRPSYSTRSGPLSPVRPLSHYTSTSVLKERGEKLSQETSRPSGIHSAQTGSTKSISPPQNPSDRVASPPIGPMGPPPSCPLPEVPTYALDSSPQRKSFSVDEYSSWRRSLATEGTKVSKGGTPYGLSRRSITCS
ncbi:MAG: hypothetical protein Q9160_002871 [Pyrenula sp. 1 TL-2023]